VTRARALAIGVTAAGLRDRTCWSIRRARGSALRMTGAGRGRADGDRGIDDRNAMEKLGEGSRNSMVAAIGSPLIRPEQSYEWWAASERVRRKRLSRKTADKADCLLPAPRRGGTQRCDLAGLTGCGRKRRRGLMIDDLRRRTLFRMRRLIQLQRSCTDRKPDYGRHVNDIIFWKVDGEVCG